MGAGNAASRYQQAFQSGGKEAAVGEVVRFAVLDVVLSLAGAGRVVDVHDKFSLVHHDVGETAAGGQFFGGDDIVAHHPAAFAHARGGAAGNDADMFIPRNVFAQETFQEEHLLAEFEVGLENLIDPGDVHPVHLGGIYLALSGMDGGVQAHGGEFLREFAFIGPLLAPIQEADAVQLHVVHIADADESFLLVHTVDGEFQGDRLHQAVFTTLVDVRTGQEGDHGVARSVNDDAAFQVQETLLGGDGQARDPVAVFVDAGHGRLKIDVDVFMVYPAGQEELGAFYIVGLAGFSDHVVLRNAQQFHQLVAHRPFAYHAQNRAYVAGRQVSTHHTVAFDQGDPGTLPGGCHGGAQARGTGSRHDYIINKHSV